MKKIYSKLIESLRTPAKPSEFISSIDQLEPGPVVAYARESTLTQKGNLPPQRSNLETQLQKRGFPVVAVIEKSRQVVRRDESGLSERSSRRSLPRLLSPPKPWIGSEEAGPTVMLC